MVLERRQAGKRRPAGEASALRGVLERAKTSQSCGHFGSFSTCQGVIGRETPLSPGKKSIRALFSSAGFSR
jgi:hypothetical protein